MYYYFMEICYIVSFPVLKLDQSSSLWSKSRYLPRASDALCLMVTMLVPRTKKIPLFTDFLGKNTPYFSQNEDFFLLPISRRAHCLMTPFKTN